MGEELSSSHSAHRCPDCKTAITALLGKLYGPIVMNPKFAVPAQLEGLRGQRSFEALKNIHGVLSDYRRRRNFTRVSTLPRSDILIVGRNQLVEIDEQQHFSGARAVALAAYPKRMRTGYSRKRWVELCVHHDARDNSPAYRDEQRAWYDTLRDFLPSLAGMNPTVRLYAADRRWCALSPRRKVDLTFFREMIEAVP